MTFVYAQPTQEMNPSGTVTCRADLTYATPAQRVLNTDSLVESTVGFVNSSLACLLAHPSLRTKQEVRLSLQAE